jgi:hypothetical protein
MKKSIAMYLLLLISVKEKFRNIPAPNAKTKKTDKSLKRFST